jgi:uncharacterized protein
MERSVTQPGIYVGTLRHRRFQPVPNAFTYPLFMVYLDIDRIPELMSVSWFTAYNRWNLAAFCDRDHFGDPALPLRQRLADDAHRNGVTLPGGKIFLLTHLRYLGHNFNPVSFFYCYDQSDRLSCIMAEVSNTFGETHNYWLTSKHLKTAASHPKYRFAKTFHVSPFMKMNQEYEWTFTPPEDKLINQCLNYEDGQVMFDSSLKLEWREWSSRQLRRVLARFPWMTLRVVASIHWQALKLLSKRVPVVSHPGPGSFQAAPVRHFGASWSNE